MRRGTAPAGTTAAAMAGLTLVAAAGPLPGRAAGPWGAGDPEGPPGACALAASDTVSSRIGMAGLAREPMEATGEAPGGGGTLEIAFAASPFGLAVTADGRPRHRVTVVASGLRPSPDGRLVAWAATPELDRVRRLGELGDDLRVEDQGLAWSRYLVFITAEPDEPAGSGQASPAAEADGPRWRGPVLLVGRAPSSRMHTMRGHGIFEAHGIGC